ncbi:aspartate kinase [Hanamia caeni]|uniref:Aspartokinase n=1 Tax=Hanamia caeni TaxID=2294116 RepID=A0A3M9ND85_9BACT|nr:aspartate kinase [Hanamia caeni]RNI35173.1 aspartate kinase [Hanamia caeni]
MKIFKFGGASTNSFDRIQNLGYILQNHTDEKILIVISAMGKMTNSLEKVVEEFYEGKNEEALRLFQKVKDYHLNQLKYLVTFQWQKATNQLTDFFTEVEWLLHDKPVKDYDYYYDQIVCSGELLSSTLISYYLNENRIPNKWIDVRDVLRTDDTFRQAKVDWDVSRKQAREKLMPLFDNTNFVITQGFIGSTDENESTTLGREGSDFTAAIFAELMNAESVTIWKDVNGVMNADPKDFQEAVTIDELSYKEVIEMAYYGAQVIHPKTIKPLQNKDIPLFVRSFFDLRLTGTVITQKSAMLLPPMIVYKRRQVLLMLQSVDFSFVEGKPTTFLYEVLRKLNIRPNLTQNTAISLIICMDDADQKIQEVSQEVSEIFDVSVQKNLTLLTVRHYSDAIIEQLSANKEIILQQKTKDTIQLLMNLS